MLRQAVFFAIVGAFALVTMPAEGQGTQGLRERAMDTGFELQKKFTLRFYNAVKGTPVAGARVTFEGQVGSTDATGAVRFDFPGDLKSGQDDRIAHFSRKGYVSAKVPVEFMVGTLFFYRYSVSPSIPVGYVRIVLDWLPEPPDLDAHLVKDGVYRLSYRDMKKYRDRAWLDRDDTDGEGPETITVKRVEAGATYHFRVHDFTNQTRRRASKLAESRAHVRVYSSTGLLRSFRVPAQGRGTVWHVFDLIDGELRPVNRVDASL